MSRYFAYLTKRHHPEERERWFRAIQRDNIPDGPNTFVCEHHWPKDYETIIKYGKARPKYPPSVFTQCVVPSQVPTPLPPPRPTTKADASSRNIIPDDLAAFLERDRLLSFEDLCQKVMGKNCHYFGSCGLLLHWKKRTFRYSKYRLH